MTDPYVNGRLMLTKLGFLLMVNVTPYMAYIQIPWVIDADFPVRYVSSPAGAFRDISLVVVDGVLTQILC